MIHHETYIDTMTIVRNLKQLQTSLFDHYFKGCRAGINGIFNEFFESMHRRNNYLASSDLVDDIGIKGLG
jgi:hypothetical protein